MATATPRFNKHLPVPNMRLRFGGQRPSNAKALQAVGSARKASVQLKRATEVSDCFSLSALRLVDVATVVVGQGIGRIELDRGGVICCSTRMIAGLSVCKPAMIEGAR